MMRPRPVLFLDIDGVLSHRAWLDVEHAAGRKTSGRIDPHATARLQRIVDATACTIVLSSTWRLIWSLRDMRAKLRSAGLRQTLRGCTPELQDLWFDRSPCRSRAELRGQPRPPYVCVDAEDEGITAHGHPLVRTSFSAGLTAELADRAIRSCAQGHLPARTRPRRP